MPAKELRIRFVGDTKGVTAALGQLETGLQRFSRNLASTGRTLTRGLSVPLAAFGVLAVKEFSEAAQASAQTAAAIESTGGAANVTKKHVEELAERIGRMAALEDELVQESANVLLSFTKIRNEVGEGNAIFDRANVAVADVAARMKTDLVSASKQVGKALNDPIRGLTSLGRAGVQFTDQQKEQITTLVESGRVLDAQRLILHELEVQVGGSAAAAGRAASPFQKMQLAVQDLGEQIGRLLLPFMRHLVRFARELADRFKGLSPETQRMAVTIGLLAIALGPLLSVLAKLITVMRGVGAAMSFLMAHPIVALIAIAAVLILNWEKVSAFFRRMFAGIRRGFENMVKVVGANVDAMLGPIDELIAGLARLIGLLDVFKNAATSLSKPEGNLFNPPGDIRWHSGGEFRTRRPGGEGLAILRDREMVLTPKQMAAMGGGVTFNFNAPVYGMRDFEDHVVKAWRAAKRRRLPP
jgi:hypothetical protein